MEQKVQVKDYKEKLIETFLTITKVFVQLQAKEYKKMLKEDKETRQKKLSSKKEYFEHILNQRVLSEKLLRFTQQKLSSDLGLSDQFFEVLMEKVSMIDRSIP